MNAKALIGLVVVASLAIVIGSAWTAFAQAGASDTKLEIPRGGPLLVGALVLAATSMLAGALAWLVSRIRKTDYKPPPPGRWAYAWTGLQLACLLALLVLGVATLVAFAFGTEHSSPMLHALILVIVGSGLLFVVGASVRNIFRAISSVK